MVLYNLNMVHLICKAYSKYNTNPRQTKVWYMLSLLMVSRYIWVFSLISSCVLYLLSSYVFWTELEVDLWHLVDVIYYDYTHIRSVQNRVNAKQISSFFSLLRNCDGLISLLDDQRSLTNIHEFLLDLQIFVVVIFQLRRCHSIFSCCLHYSLHSAILSWKK